MGRFDFKAACDPVGDGSEVLEASVAAGSSTGELEVAVDGFDGGGCGVVSEVAEDAFKVTFQASSQGDEGCHPGAATPAHDGFEMITGVFLVTVVPSVCEEVPNGEGAGDLRMLAADAFAQFELLGLEVLHVPAKRPECAARQAAGLTGDLLAGGVEGLAAELHDMEAVEADSRIGKVFTGTGDEGFGHVDGDFLDLGGIDLAPGEFGGELVEGGAVLAGCEEEQPRNLGSAAATRGFLAGDFEEGGAVLVAFAGGCLIDAETFERTPVSLFPNLIDAAADEVPDAVLADLALRGDLGDGEDFGEGKQVGFHEQGESALRPGPRKFGVANLARGRLDARHAGTQGGAVFEEMKVLPGSLDGVVYRAGLAGLRVGETAARLEVNDEFEGLCLGIEVSGNDLPWRGESECLGKEMFDSHAPEYARGGVTHKAPPLRRVFHDPFSQQSLMDNSPEKPNTWLRYPLNSLMSHFLGSDYDKSFSEGAFGIEGGRSQMKPDDRYPKLVRNDQGFADGFLVYGDYLAGRGDLHLAFLAYTRASLLGHQNPEEVKRRQDAYLRYMNIDKANRRSVGRAGAISVARAENAIKVGEKWLEQFKKVESELLLGEKDERRVSFLKVLSAMGRRGIKRVGE